MLRPQQTPQARHVTSPKGGRFAKIAKQAQGTSDGSGNLLIVFKDAPPPTQIWTGTVFVDAAPSSMSTKAIVGVTVPGLTAATAANAGVPWGTAIGGGALQVQVDGADSASLILVSTTAPINTTFTAWFIGSSTDSEVAAEVGYSFPFPAPPTSGIPAFVGIGAITTSTGTTVTPPLPGGAAGYYIAIVALLASGLTCTPSAGWSQVAIITDTSNGSNGLFAFVAAGSIGGPPTFTVGAGGVIAVVLAYGGAGSGAIPATAKALAGAAVQAAPVILYGAGNSRVVEAFFTAFAPSQDTIGINNNNPMTRAAQFGPTLSGNAWSILIVDFPAGTATSMTGDAITAPGGAGPVSFAITINALS